MRIWSCALGRSESEIIEAKPESDEFFKNIWLKTAVDNSDYFWKCFRNLPHNSITKYLMEDTSYKEWNLAYEEANKKPVETKTQILSNIRGYLINYQSK